MRRRHLAAATSGLACLAAFVVAPSAAAEDASCSPHAQLAGAARSLIDAGELSAARTVLAAAVAEDQTRACAVALLEELREQEDVATAALRRAQDLVAAEDDEGAAAAYLDALAADHSLAAARDGLAALVGDDDDGAPDDPFAAAKRLADAGFITEARAAAVEALQERATADPREVPEQARPEDDDWWLSRFVGWFPEGVRATFRPANLGILLAIVAAAFVLLVAILKWRSPPAEPERHGAPVRRSLTSTLARPFVVPVVTFVVDETGADVKAGAALRDRVMATLTRDRANDSLDRAGAADVSALVEDLVLKLPGLGAAAKLIGRIMARRSITVTITIAPATSSRVDVSASLTDWRGRTRDADTFSAPVPDAKDPKTISAAYLSLSTPLAAWLAFRLRELWNPDGRPLTVRGTSNASSYGEFLAGLRVHTTDPADARVHYMRALASDAGNRPARINAAALDARDVDRLDDAIALLTATDGSTEADPTTRAQTSYLLAVSHLHRATIESRADDLVEAVRIVRDLLEDLDRQAASDDEETKVFALNNRPAADSLLVAATLAHRGPANLDQVPAAPAPSTDDEQRAASVVDALLTLDPDAATAAVRERWRTARERSLTSYKAAYNVACVYARAFAMVPPDHWSSPVLARCAFRHLGNALAAAQPSTREWAKTHDPALAALRERCAPAWRALFRQPAPSGEAKREWVVTTAA